MYMCICLLFQFDILIWGVGISDKIAVTAIKNIWLIFDDSLFTKLLQLCFNLKDKCGF